MPPILTSGRRGWTQLWVECTGIKLLLQPQRTRDKPENCTGRRQGKLELAHSSHVSTFPDGPEGVQGGATCSGEPDQSSDYRKAWKKRGIVPAAAGPEPRLNPLEKEQHGIAQPRLQSLGMLSSGLRQICAWSANHNSSSHGTGPAQLEQVSNILSHIKSCHFLYLCSTGHGLKAELTWARF